MTAEPMTPVFRLDSASCPSDLSGALQELRKVYPALRGGKTAPLLSFRRTGARAECSVRSESTGFCIHYRKPNMALRMVGNLLAGVRRAEPESCPFETFGIMLDCSRNAVMTVEHLKAYLRKLAILGYNTVMLYTEDTYEVEGEPYFGIMRGAYTRREMREIDAYAQKLGISVIPCIQTLGHLEQIIRWERFSSVADTGRVLLADEPETYALIDKMLSFWADTVHTRRIHLGMDEAHDIGRGKFYDHHGDEDHFAIFNRHFAKVAELCKKHGLTPMIWSDMYFRIGSKTGDYYDPGCSIPPEVVRMIPENAGLVYWDYFHETPDFYLDWIARHRAMGKEPVMASGVWTWNKFWYDHASTRKTVVPCMEACRSAKVREVFFTMWGDDGEFCDFDSAFAGLAYASELAFTGSADTPVLDTKFNVLLAGADFSASLEMSSLEEFGAPAILWDDPLMLMYLGNMKKSSPERFELARKTAERVSRKLARLPKTLGAGDLRHAHFLAKTLSSKLELADFLLRTYSSKGPADRLKPAFPLIQEYRRTLAAFTRSFREMWLRHNKPFGLETMQVRLAGADARAAELECRLKDFCAGRVKNIPELDELRKFPKNTKFGWYAKVARGSTII